MAGPWHQASSELLPMASLSPGFVVVFVVFALAILVLSFLTLRWAIRRDRIGRQAWLRRRQAEMAAPLDVERDLGAPPGRRRTVQRGADTNGHEPGSSP